jgi:hypothetical protein
VPASAGPTTSALLKLVVSSAFGRREQLFRHYRRDEAGEAAERERVGDPGRHHHQRDQPVRPVADDQHERCQRRRDHQLVGDHQAAPAAGQVEPGAQQRAGDQARQRDRGHREAGEPGAAGAVE